MLAAWHTNSRVTSAAHIHNARCTWVNTLGSEHGISTPARVVSSGIASRSA